MKIEKIILLVGLPGSGKTTIGNALVNDASPIGSTLFIDDISIITNNAKEYLHSLILENISQIIISDVYFSQEHVRDAASKTIQEVFPNTPIEYFFFENSVEKCLFNVEKRKELGDNRRVESLVKILSKQYRIPEGYIAIEVNNSKTKTLKF